MHLPGYIKQGIVSQFIPFLTVRLGLGVNQLWVNSDTVHYPMLKYIYALKYVTYS